MPATILFRPVRLLEKQLIPEKTEVQGILKYFWSMISSIPARFHSEAM